MNNDKKTVYDYDLHVNGLFGRNRKVKRELFSLTQHLDAKLSPDAVSALVQAKLASLKLRGTWALYEREGAIENVSGVEFYSTMLAFGAKPIMNGAQE